MNLAIGTAQFGLNYGIANRQGKTSSLEVTKILNLAKSHGIDLLDTAQAYGNAEEVIGKNNASDFKVVTKLLPGTKGETIKHALKDSLRKLKKEKFYGVLFHSLEDYKNDSLTWDFLQEQKKEGKIEKVGFSLYNPEELETVFEAKADLIQIPLNVLDRKFEPYLIEIAKRNIEIHVRSVFLQGLFFIDPNDLPEKMKVFEPDLKKLIAQFPTFQDRITFLFAFVKQFNFISTIVAGVNNATQLKELIRAFNKEIKPSYNNLFLPENWKGINHPMTNPAKWN